MINENQKHTLEQLTDLIAGIILLTNNEKALLKYHKLLKVDVINLYNDYRDIFDTFTYDIAVYLKDQDYLPLNELYTRLYDYSIKFLQAVKKYRWDIYESNDYRVFENHLKLYIDTITDAVLTHKNK